MNTKHNCPGKKFYNDAIQGCIDTRKEKPYLSKKEKERLIKQGSFLQKTATQIEIAMEYAFESTTQKEQETEAFKKAMHAMNSYRQAIYYQGGFMQSCDYWSESFK